MLSGIFLREGLDRFSLICPSCCFVAVARRDCACARSKSVRSPQGGQSYYCGRTRRRNQGGRSLPVIASEAKQSITRHKSRNGLLRRFAPLRKRSAFVAGNDADKFEYDKATTSRGQMRFARSDPLPDRFRYRDRAMGVLISIDPDDLAGHERLIAALQEDRELEGEA